VAKLERVYYQAIRELEKIKVDIQQLEDELKVLQGKYERAIADRQRLQAEAEVMERQLVAADKLISGLGSEKSRYNMLLISNQNDYNCDGLFYITLDVEKADIALPRGNPTSELRDITCHMRSHSVTCHPTQCW